MPDRATPFTEMFAIGNLLIEAQRLEGAVSKLYRKRPTPERLKEWTEARRSVELLAQDYLVAIRVWRESIEAEIRARPASAWRRCR